MKFIIVGAGPTGLAAAFRLSVKGHQVQVVERRPSSIHGPGSIQIVENGANILESWGLYQDFSDSLTRILKRQFLRYSDIDRLCTLTSEVKPRWVVHRDDIQRILTRNAIQAGAEILFEKEVVRVGTDNTSVHLSDGSALSGDIIIGADGLRSIVREAMFPDVDTSPYFTSTICYQAMIPSNLVDNNADTGGVYKAGEVLLLMGPGCYVVGWPQEKRKEYYFAILDTRSDQTVGGVSGQPQTDEEMAARVKQILSNYATPIKQIAALVEKWTPWHIACGSRDIPWVTTRGNVILIADAAHAMTPDAAQGLSQGLEDVEALTILLEHATKDNIGKVAKAYETLRKPRATRTQAYAAANSPIMDMKDGPEQEARDKRLKEIDGMREKEGFKDVVPDPNATFVEPAFVKWMTEYNVSEEAQRLAHELQLST